MAPVSCFSIWGLLIPVAYGQIFQGGAGIDAPGNFSTACSATFNQTIACNVTLNQVALGDYFPTANDLPSICTSGCLNALESLRVQQVSDCTSSDVVVSGGVVYPPTLNTDLLLLTYNYTCLKDPATGSYCSPSFFEWNNDTSSATAAELCSNCNLLVQQAQLDSPLGWDAGGASAYSSLTSSCRVTKYPIKSPTAYFSSYTGTGTTSGTVTTASAAYPCKSTYTIQAADTCKSVCNSQNVATFALMQANNLPGYCSDFPAAGSKLCIPQTCDLYTVATNDTCFSIVQTHNGTFSITQLTSWNPNINRDCSNLNMIEGYQICVSFPGPASTAAVTTSATVTTPVASIPTDHDLAPNTTTDCGRYYLVAFGDTCASITVAMGISLNDFYFLNPMINSTCGNLWRDTYYCVEPIGNIATYSGYENITATKNPCLQISAPSSCFVTTYATTTAAFTWPAVMNTTSTTASTASFPSATSTNNLPLAPGSLEHCGSYTQYFNSSSSRINFNTCDYIAYIIAVNVTDFIAWNPSLKYDPNSVDACELVAGYRYCTSNGTATSSSSSSSSSSGSSSSSSSNISPNGLCGTTNQNYTCAGSQFGTCCSKYGNCGSTEDYCGGSGCQSAFGTCSSSSVSSTAKTSPTRSSSGGGSSSPTVKLSPDGSCGGTNGYTCETPNCCGQYGYCGSTNDFCGQGCQAAFGQCGSGSGAASSSRTTSAKSGSSSGTGSGTISTNGGCGSAYNNWNCAGSGFGDCCSKYNFCGSTAQYCDVSAGCQTQFGKCTNS